MLRSPFFRIPFLAFAIFSSVATSQPAWFVESDPIEGVARVEPEKISEVMFDVQTNQNASLGAEARIVDVQPESAEFKLAFVCGSAEPQLAQPDGGTPTVLVASCSGTSDRARLLIENTGDDDLTLTWRVTGRVMNNGSDEVPEGTTVTITKVP